MGSFKIFDPKNFIINIMLLKNFFQPKIYTRRMQFHHVVRRIACSTSKTFTTSSNNVIGLINIRGREIKPSIISLNL
jgi:hypothetical protein